MSIRRAFTALTMLLTGLLLAGAAAWACTPQATISVSPGSGRGGSTATVTGYAFKPGQVEILWEGSAWLGNATSDGERQFQAAIRIPDVAPSTYTIVARQGQYSARAAFQVTVAPSSPPPPKHAAVAPRSSATGPAAGNRAPGRGSSPTYQAATPPGPVSGQAAEPAAGASQPAAGLPGGGTGGGSMGSTGVGDPPGGDGGLGTSLSPRMVSDDLWSGLEAGERAPMSGPVGLIGSAPAAPSGSTVERAAGAGLLSAGLVALLSALTAAQLRKRRSLADSRPADARA